MSRVPRVDKSKVWYLPAILKGMIFTFKKMCMNLLRRNTG